MIDSKKVAYFRQYALLEKEGERTREEWEYWYKRAKLEDSLSSKGREAAKRTQFFGNLILKRNYDSLNKRVEMEEVIRQLPDTRLQLLLYLHYVDGLSLERTAERLKMSTRYVARLHAKALEEISLPLQQNLVS